MSKRIVIIAGGGVFGMIPVCLLNSIGIKDIREHVDAIGGTSIGGICALYLAQGKSTQNLYDDFKVEVKNIFSKSMWRSMNPFASEYPEGNINASLKRMLPGKFKDIKDISVIIPTVNFKMEQPKIFDNIIQDEDVEMDNWEIARATAAAPTYFPPHSSNIYIDGGIVENSPIMTTVTCLKSKLNIRFEDMKVLAIGTGNMKVPKRTLSEVSRYTQIDWLKNLLIPFVTKSNEMASDFWATQINFKDYMMYNPISITGDMDNASLVTDGTLENLCKPHYEDFKQIWNSFIS
jgi:patatin-like phospholipase/acyl hydrolase